MSPGTGQPVIKIVVADADDVCSFTWRIWSSRTSFNIKPDGPGFQVKFSLHGPDPRHGWHGFKLAWDGDTSSDAAVAIATPGFLPAIFSGKTVDTGADQLDCRHVMRLRMPWDIFTAPAVSPGRLRPDQTGLRVAAPRCPLSADIDLYVTTGKPFWPNESQARRDNAVIGPLSNEAGQYLTGVSRQTNMLTGPTPDRAEARSPLTFADAIRGTSGCIDDDGVAWIVERWLPRSLLTPNDAYKVREQHQLALASSMQAERLRPVRGRTWWRT